MITHPYYRFILDPKSKQDKLKVTYLKNLPKLQIFKFWKKNYKWHTFWSCLIRWVLLKIQSGQDSVHRWTDRRMDRWTLDRWIKVKPVYPSPFQLRWNGGYNKIDLKKKTISFTIKHDNTITYNFFFLSRTEIKHITASVVNNYGISNTIVLEIP